MDGPESKKNLINLNVSGRNIFQPFCPRKTMSLSSLSRFEPEPLFQSTLYDDIAADFRPKLKNMHFWEVKEIEISTIRKLKTSLSTLSRKASHHPESLTPNFFSCYIEPFIILKLVYEDKDRRKNTWLKKKLYVLFGNKTASRAAWCGAIIGAGISTIAFGMSPLFDKEVAISSLIILGVAFIILGTACAFSAEGFKFYYDSVHTSDQQKRIQRAFSLFFLHLCQSEYTECENILKNLSLEDKLVIDNELDLLILLDSLEKRDARKFPSPIARKSVNLTDFHSDYAEEPIRTTPPCTLEGSGDVLIDLGKHELHLDSLSNIFEQLTKKQDES